MNLILIWNIQSLLPKVFPKEVKYALVMYQEKWLMKLDIPKLEEKDIMNIQFQFVVIMKLINAILVLVIAQEEPLILVLVVFICGKLGENSHKSNKLLLKEIMIVFI